MRILLSALTSVTLLLSCGCSRAEEDRRHRFRIKVENNIETAVTTGGPKYEGELFHYEHVLTLQEDEERENSLLSHPTVFTRDEFGYYYVVDSTQRRIAVFDNLGSYVHSFGQRGNGPGDFMSPFLQYVRNGVVSIWDRINYRVTRFNTSGEFIDVDQKPLDFRYVPRGLFHTENGGLVVFRPFVVGSCSTQVEVGSYDKDDKRIATIESPLILNQVELENPSVNRMVRAPIPFAPIPTATYRPGKGILVSAGHQPVLEWYDVRGAMTARIVVDCLDTRLDDEARERFRRLWQDRLELYPHLRANVNIFGDESLLPESIPHWTFIFVDDAGYYWLRCPDPVYQDYLFSEGYRYYLLSPEGEYLGITRTPPEYLIDEQQAHLIPVSVAHGYYMGISDDPETGGKLMQVYWLVPAIDRFQYP